MGSSLPTYPERIVCLTEETTETLYLLGEGHRVVGISGYTLRPPEARSKPKVSSFISARFDKIEALEPDLILTFSDLQADIASELVKRGLPVFAFNQRSVGEILQMIRVLAGIVGCEAKGQALVAELERGLEAIRRPRHANFSTRPRVFFEEWDEPLISGIQWVEELVEIAGGEPIFPELREKRLAKDRIVQADEVRPANARRHSCIVVRQEDEEEHDRVAGRMGRRARRQARSHLRHPVDLHSSARPALR